MKYVAHILNFTDCESKVVIVECNGIPTECQRSHKKARLLVEIPGNQTHKYVVRLE